MQVVVARSSVARQAAVRLYSRCAPAAQQQEPKLHKAVGNWETLIAAKRPIDADETHVSYY